MSKNDAFEGLPTLPPMAKVMDGSRERGFTENFQITDKRTMQTTDGSKNYAPHEVEIVNFSRYEGMSNPADSAVLYEIKTSDGTKGLLVENYSAKGDGDKSAFLRQVQTVTKQRAEKETETIAPVKNHH